jgi:hypothetical protein
LNLIITTVIIPSRPSTTNGINLIKKDDACSLRPGHGEEFSDHPCTFPDILLNELGTYHTDEARISSVCYGTCREGFT